MVASNVKTGFASVSSFALTFSSLASSSLASSGAVSGGVGQTKQVFRLLQMQAVGQPNQAL